MIADEFEFPAHYLVVRYHVGDETRGVYAESRDLESLEYAWSQWIEGRVDRLVEIHPLAGGALRIAVSQVGMIKEQTREGLARDHAINASDIVLERGVMRSQIGVDYDPDRD